ncbi:MAG: ABC transporter permease [Acidobacteria bacterium]|nr:ABC transporter permease [Acidobacteriota bacterium]
MRTYDLLLRLLPASFRVEYGDDMRAIFEKRYHNATGAARLTLWAGAIWDVVTSAARVHADILRQDLRTAFRSLAGTPGFTFTAVLVAALGIGATTATFSIADHVLLRPLPFSEPDRLVKVWLRQTSLGYGRLEPSPPAFREWRERVRAFDNVEAYTSDATNALGAGDPERLSGARVTGGMLGMLGRPAAIGRVLLESDVTTETQNALVISDRLWRTRFGADANVLGQTISLDDATYVIVGVMPADFHFPDRAADYWRPLRFLATNGDDDWTNYYLQVVARLRAGVTVDQTRAELQALAVDLQRDHPKELSGTDFTLFRWRDEVSQQPRMMLFALVGASLCVLLIACTNLANLLMSRALARRTELAVRVAIGASAHRLLRQLLTDSLIVAAAGGLLGIAIAVVSMPLVVRMIPTALPIAEVPSLDLRMLLVAAGITVLTGLAFGVMPALRVSMAPDTAALKEGARSGTLRSTARLRSALVLAEIVGSVVLLVSAGLLVRALLNVQRVDPGFRADNALTLRTALPRPKYNLTERREAFYRQVLDDIHALPGVRKAAYISFLPMTMRGGIWPVLTTVPDADSPQGFVAPDPRDRRSASLRFVTPGFFEAIGTPFISGRDVSASDTRTTPLVAVVSQSFARQHFPDRDPIGQAFAIAFGARTIVGVVGDIRVRGLERDSEPQVYLPASQQMDGQLGFYAPADLVVRSSVPPTTLIPAVRSIIAKADPQQPISRVMLLENVVAEETAPRRVQLRVVGAFAGVALILAAIGIHGLLAFTVSARTREIGVRLALGATPRRILGDVLGQGVTLAIAGVVIGGIAALGVGRLMQSLLAGVNPADTTTLLLAGLVVAVMSIAGALLPAWRAMRIDPITALRTD